MLVENVRTIEKQYFLKNNERVIPELLCYYFENKNFEVVYYLSDKHKNIYGEAKFYLMMSLFELEYIESATYIYSKNKGEWYNFCKQYKIYWKHVALFALYFCDYNISDYYMIEFDNHYDDVLVKLLEVEKMLGSNSINNTEIFKKAIVKYPLINNNYIDLKNIKHRGIISFEDIQWNLWRKYNNQVFSKYKYGMELVYQDEKIKIFSYKPREVSASMHIITDNETTIILDCGCEIDGDITNRIFVKEILDCLEINNIDCIFISHAHMDHYGSLNEVRGIPLVMTSKTKQLIKYSSPEIALDNVQIINDYDSFAVDNVIVRFIPNGHILGSILMDINWKNNKRIVYTGDYCIENQRTVAGLKLKDVFLENTKGIDILITETTYGTKKNMLKLSQYERMFVEICKKEFEYGNKMIIPCFAVGRAQEIALLLSPIAKQLGIKILIDGLAGKITEYYQLAISKDILNSNISIGSSEIDLKEKIFNNDIILASSGMMKVGSASFKYIQELINHEHICIMKVGFMHKDEHMLVSILNRINKNINFIDIPLSAHVGYTDIVNTMEELTPDCAIYVHGSGIDK